MMSEQCSISWYKFKNHTKCILDEGFFLGIQPNYVT